MNQSRQTAENGSGAEKIAIIGLGLMGSSLGLAAREAGMRVAAYARREESRRIAQKSGMADSVHASPAEAVRGAGIVVLCTPIRSMPELVSEILPELAAGCVVTDVGSTKSFPERCVAPLLSGTDCIFIGSHPLTGSEQSGTESATVGLYRDAAVFVTPSGDTPAWAYGRIKSFWEKTGARVISISADEHDAVMARTSHLPHLAVAALVNAVIRDKADFAQFCGSGFRDTTRIAEGPPEVWRDIALTNRDHIMSEIDNFITSMQTVRKYLEDNDASGLEKLLAKARTGRREI